MSTTKAFRGFVPARKKDGAYSYIYDKTYSIKVINPNYSSPGQLPKIF